MIGQIAEAALAPVDVASKQIRLFKVGPNATLGETYLFDAESLRTCLEARKQWNVRVHFDLEHRATLPKENPNYLGDAMGWGDLEGRAGELWIVRFEPTAEGHSRIKNKTQSYLSPTFYHDFRNGQYGSGQYVTSIFNVALTGLPQTLGAQMLMAASATVAQSSRLTPSDAQICRRTGCSPQMWARLSAERASLSAEVIWDPKQNPQLLQIAKERGLQGSFAEIKAQIEAQQVRDAQLAEVFGTTPQQIELTRKRLGLKPQLQLSAEEIATAKEMGCLPAVYEILKAQRKAGRS